MRRLQTFCCSCFSQVSHQNFRVLAALEQVSSSVRIFDILHQFFADAACTTPLSLLTLLDLLALNASFNPLCTTLSNVSFLPKKIFRPKYKKEEGMELTNFHSPQLPKSYVLKLRHFFLAKNCVETVCLCLRYSYSSWSQSKKTQSWFDNKLLTPLDHVPE